MRVVSINLRVEGYALHIPKQGPGGQLQTAAAFVHSCLDSLFSVEGSPGSGSSLETRNSVLSQRKVMFTSMLGPLLADHEVLVVCGRVFPADSRICYHCYFEVYLYLF